MTVHLELLGEGTRERRGRAAAGLEAGGSASQAQGEALSRRYRGDLYGLGRESWRTCSFEFWHKMYAR